MTAEPVTPKELARDVGVNPKTIRAYLRSKYGLLGSRNETRWLLDEAQAADVRREFQRQADL